MRFYLVVVIAILLEACCPLYLGYWITALYATHGATPAQVFVAGMPDWRQCLLLFAAAFAYWRFASARPFLQIFAIGAGIYGFVLWLPYHHFVGSWSVAHGNIIAVSGWEMIGLMIIGSLAIVDYLVSRTQRRSFL